MLFSERKSYTTPDRAPGWVSKHEPSRAQTSAIAERNAMIPGRAPPPPRRILAVAHFFEATTRTTGTPLSIIQKRLWRGRNPPRVQTSAGAERNALNPGGGFRKSPPGCFETAFSHKNSYTFPHRAPGGVFERRPHRADAWPWCVRLLIRIPHCPLPAPSGTQCGPGGGVAEPPPECCETDTKLMPKLKEHDNVEGRFRRNFADPKPPKVRSVVG